jgi:SAM-dependent methyltransferase
MEAQGMAELRTELLAGLTGRVVEIGAGNGMNFAHYPPTVTEVLAVEPEPYLRRLAAQAATTAPIPVTIVAGRAEQLLLADHSADAVVLCLVLCSLPDRPAALTEARRVLRASGTLRFLEHTIAASLPRPDCGSCSGSPMPRCGPGSPVAAIPRPTQPRPSARPGSRSPRCGRSGSPSRGGSPSPAPRTSWAGPPR